MLDTGVVYAYMDRSDADHPRCRELIDGCDEDLVIPEPTLPEIDYWISERLNVGVALAFLDDLQSGAFHLYQMNRSDYVRARELMDRYADADVGLVDCLILATVERLGENKLATLDHRHFSLMRPSHVEALELLPIQTSS